MEPPLTEKDINDIENLKDCSTNKFSESLVSFSRVSLIDDSIPESIELISEIRKSLSKLITTRASETSDILDSRTHARRRSEDAFHQKALQETTDYSTILVIIGTLLAGGISYIVTQSLDWWMIFSLAVSILLAIVSSNLFIALAEKEYVHRVNKYKDRFSEKYINEYIEILDSRSDELVGAELISETNIIDRKIRKVEAHLEHICNEDLIEKSSLASAYLDNLTGEFEITSDSSDLASKGKPYCTWNFTKLKDIYRVAFEEKADEVGVSVRICMYSGEGRKVKHGEDIRVLGEPLFSDPISLSGVYIDIEAKANTSIFYYLIAEATYLTYIPTQDGAVVNTKKEGRRLAEAHLAVERYKSEEELLDEEIRSYRVEKKREKFYEKTGQETVNVEKDSDDIADAIFEEAMSVNRRKQETIANAEKLRLRLEAEGLSKEDIEEAVENFLQKSSPSK